jgi:uncharacterized protein (TIGR00299 family) protein
VSTTLGYLECTFGVSGDKILAALIDAGADLAGLNAALAELGIGVSVEISATTANSIAAKRAHVDIASNQSERSWADIRVLIEGADLPSRVADDALAVFAALAETEAEVHGVEVDDVHFHEVGAADSIADIVGAAWCFHDLGIERLTASAITLGHGTVEARHGTLPVPAPATALLLKGVPTEGGSEPGELTTPTGAALVATLATTFGPQPAMRVAQTGVGAGSREMSVPNICRLFVGEAASCAGDEQVTLLATTIDDATPEQLAYAAERLLEEGALDVWRTPVVMKKGRAGVVFEVLATPADAPALAAALMDLTGSLGVRRSTLTRTIAEREIIEVETDMGRARVKVSRLPGRVTARAEYEDCARIAREHEIAIDEVARRIEDAARSRIEGAD